jgi:hypothetical protein
MLQTQTHSWSTRLPASCGSKSIGARIAHPERQHYPRHEDQQAIRAHKYGYLMLWREVP